MNQQELSLDNLLPIYLIEDKLQANFKKINAFIKQVNAKFITNNQEIERVKYEQHTMRTGLDKKLEDIENRIVDQITKELDGRIGLAVGKSMNDLTQKIENRMKNATQMKEEFDKKLNSLKEQIKYQTAVQGQKNMNQIAKKLQQIEKQSKQRSKSTKKTENSRKGSLTERKTQQAQNNDKWQEQHHMMKDLEERIHSLQEFSVSVDKRFYNGMTSLKDSWKQLGTQLLDNKNSVEKKLQDLRGEILKIKNSKDLEIPTSKLDDEFKRKLAQKFADIYTIVGTGITKNQYQLFTQKINAQIARHDDQFIQIRNQLAINNQYFTFYAKNADREDLKQQIDDLSAKFIENSNNFSSKISNFQQKILERVNQMQQTKSYVSEMRDKIMIIKNLSQDIAQLKQKVESLQQFNKFGPEKLQKIHNVLDMDFTATQKELIDVKNKKNSITNVQQSQRDLKNEMIKLKDEIFLITSQTKIKQQELSEIRTMYKELEIRIEKMKGQNEQAMLTRKPWVCLSCDKQQKQKEIAKRQTKIKKPQPFKGFGQQRSEKNIKIVAPAPPTPLFQQRFEVYDRLRQKYLSDTIKLPQIFKQKLKDKDSSMQL